MGDPKFLKHCFDYDVYLKRAKKDFDLRWKNDLQQSAKMTDFILLRTLGAGSFGRVILVKQRDKDEKVFAMKVMEKKHIVKTKQIQHTYSEIRTMDSFRFDFLINMEYYFRDNVYIFILMPYINGGEMFTHLRQLKKFDETLSKFYAAQVILAFEYIHYLGMVYRDLKPENILLDKEGYIKITDYGFCKKIDDQRTYTLCGTPEYLAPEIIMSQGYNKSVDWWALGILIYEMSAGFPPFFAKDPMRIYEKIVSGKYMMPPHFSKALRDIVTNILQVDRTKRYGILRNGSKDVKAHDWFRSVDWENLLLRKIKPIYKPRIGSSAADTSNFDNYGEEPLRTNNVEEYKEEFEGFG